MFKERYYGPTIIIAPYYDFNIRYDELFKFALDIATYVKHIYWHSSNPIIVMPINVANPAETKFELFKAMIISKIDGLQINGKPFRDDYKPRREIFINEEFYKVFNVNWNETPENISDDLYLLFMALVTIISIDFYKSNYQISEDQITIEFCFNDTDEDSENTPHELINEMIEDAMRYKSINGIIDYLMNKDKDYYSEAFEIIKPLIVKMPCLAEIFKDYL